MTEHLRACRNPRCGDVLNPLAVVPLCPSCRFVGKIGLAIGAVLAGLAMRFFQ